LLQKPDSPSPLCKAACKSPPCGRPPSHHHLPAHQDRVQNGDSQRFSMILPPGRSSSSSERVAKTAPRRVSRAQQGLGFLLLVNSEISLLYRSWWCLGGTGLRGVRGGVEGSSDDMVHDARRRPLSSKGFRVWKPTSMKHRLGMCHWSSKAKSCCPYIAGMPRSAHLVHGSRRYTLKSWMRHPHTLGASHTALRNRCVAGCEQRKRYWRVVHILWAAGMIQRDWQTCRQLGLATQSLPPRFLDAL